jgi:serine/threonine protein kinase
MGQVWRARDTLLNRPVAVKVLRSEYTADPTFLARFRAEAVHAASLSHPNIAAVYDYGEVDADEDGEHLAYLVMELVDGEPLSARLRAGALGTEATLSVLRQAAAALAEATPATGARAAALAGFVRGLDDTDLNDVLVELPCARFDALCDAAFPAEPLEEVA